MTDEYVCPQCGPTGSVNAKAHAEEFHTAGVDDEDQAAAQDFPSDPPTDPLQVGSAAPSSTPAAENPPVPVLAGTFAVYEDGKGGYVLVTDTTTAGEERRHIPAAIVKMATGGGMLGRRFAGLFGGGA